MRKALLVAVGAVAALVVVGGVLAASPGRGVLFQALFNAGTQNAVDRTAYAKIKDWVSVKDYGAAGDGIVNDETAVQQAITNAGGAGGSQLIQLPCPGSYKTTSYGTLDCGVYYPPIGLTGGVLRSVATKLLETISVTDFGADNTGLTDSTTAFQNAIDAVSGATLKGAILYIPSGTYLLCSGLPLVVSKSLDMRGAGWNYSVGGGPNAGSRLVVCDGLGSTTDVFLIQPTGSLTITQRYENFSIVAQNSNTGRYVFHLDGTNGEVLDSMWSHIFFSINLGQKIFYGEGTGLGSGTPAISTIQDSTISGAIQFTTAGDAVRIIRNRFAGTSGQGTAIDLSYQAGSSSTMIMHNNMLLNGGAAIHFGTDAIAPMIVNNEIETDVGFTGSNGSLVDLDGTSGSHVKDAIVTGNSFQVVNNITTDALRVNYSDRATISGNRFGRGLTTSHDIIVTANATATHVGENAWASGTPFTSMINDSGTGTTALFSTPGSSGMVLIPNGKKLGAVDDAGTARAIITSFTDGTMQLNGYHGASILESVPNGNDMYDQNGNITARFGAAVPPANFFGTSTWTTTSGLAVQRSVNADSDGMKHKRGVGGCATAAAAGATCTTTFSWTTAFADANYTAVCFGNAITSGVPVLGGFTKLAASLTVTTVAVTAAAAQFTNIECIAMHD